MDVAIIAVGILALVVIVLLVVRGRTSGSITLQWRKNGDEEE